VAETTLCTCIEAGGLEEQVMLLAESLRAFGGRYADLPFVAVRPRAGPRLAATTRRTLARLNIELVEKPLNADFAWWAHANKPATVDHVERHATTPNVTWMDGDMAVLAEPLGFAPPQGYDFIARAGEAYDVASSGTDDRADFWERLCAVFDLDFAAFPMITSFPDDKPIRAYWQTGLFTYRRGLGYAARYHAIMTKMLAGSIASKNAGVYHTDQVAASLTVQAMKLRYAEYDPRMNFNVNPADRLASLRIPITDVRIMHYHGALWPEDYGWAQTVIDPLAADRKALIARYAPFQGGGGLLKLQRKLWSKARAPRIKAYEARVVRY
jgi:hypothetical protein